ncbi:ABC-2 type transport system ATP-binding protein [Nakamurella sp. UYEF19]|uniref:alpha/beta fold hydrolase n=1 Tax=Nakamurella sp. UYEF19 TaxID=1756392 RepID=UPI0033991DA3
MKHRLGLLLAGRTRKAIAGIVVLVVVAGLVLATRTTTDSGPAIQALDETISVPGGPGVNGNVSIDATLYVPAEPGPVPAVLMAHGFGGSKDSIARDARTLATDGFVVLAYSARGFGQSTGQIALDSLDYEVSDARTLVTWLSKRPEVLLDAPGDPRVGVTGASYGGGLSLMLAGTDKRIDAVVPQITWNNLGAALFPNAVNSSTTAAGTPAAATPATDGVFKKSWAAALLSSVISGTSLSSGSVASTAGGSGGFGSGGNSSSTTTAEAPDPAPSATAPTPSTAAGTATAGCGRLMLAVCAAYSEAAQTGRETSTLAALLARSSPSAVVGDITAPTLLVQGENDTLFGLDQADANARAIAANGATVAVTWYDGGHDGGSPDQATRDRITNWFTYYLQKTGTKPDTSFRYSVDGPLSDNGNARSRILQVAAYPGLSGAAPVVDSTIALTGAKQTVLNPPGGAPAGISSLPGISGLAGTLLGNFAGGLPGQVARFRSAPLEKLTVIAGTPQITVDISAVPLGSAATRSSSAGTGGTSADSSAVLFASMSKISAGGTKSLAGSAVAPIRITGLPADGSAKTVRIDLPAVGFQVEVGSSIEIDLSTTDQAYAGPTSPSVYQISLTGGAAAGASDSASGILSVPEVGGVRVSAGDVPVGKLIALIVLFVLAVLGLFLLGRVRGPRRIVEGDPTVAATDPVVTGHAPTGTGAPVSATRLPLEIVGLGKSYPGGVAAVTDVSFRVEPGQVLGLLGPNGAGKTTTLRMVMGLITPTAGEIRVFGRVVKPGADILARIGSFVEGSGFLPHLSGKANLDLYWQATGRPRADAHLAEALEIAALGKAINRKVKTYSQGMRQRLAIAQSMLGLPDLLILDEPTNGLDPPQIHAMREVLRGYAATGRTVVVSSHMLSEVEQTCSHVVVVHQGRTIASGTVAEMVSASGDMVFTVDAQARAMAVLRALPGIGEVEIDDPAGPQQASDATVRGGVVRADLGASSAAAAVSALVDAGIGVSTAAPRNRLEDVFLELVGAAGPSTISGGTR